jgi:hypothetical protein
VLPHSIVRSYSSSAGCRRLRSMPRPVRYLFKPPSMSLDVAAYRFPRGATRHMRRSRKSTDQAARQIATFGEAVASAWRSYGNAVP